MPTFYRQPRWLSATQSVPSILKKDSSSIGKSLSENTNANAYEPGFRGELPIELESAGFEGLFVLLPGLHEIYRKPTLTTT